MASSIERDASGPPTAPSVPPCRSLGVQCKSLRVTLRIGELEEGSDSLDHEATWLLGHTQHIDFLELWEGDGELYVDAVRPAGATAAATGGRQIRGGRGLPERGADPAAAGALAARVGAGRRIGGREPMRNGGVPHRRQHPEGRLLPRPPGRD